MKIHAFCDRGFEKYIAQFLDGRNISVETGDGFIVLDVDERDKQSVLSLYYSEQWPTKILCWSVCVGNTGDLGKAFTIPAFWSSDKTYAIRTQGFDDETEVISVLAEHLGKASGSSVNLSHPDILVYVVKRGDLIICGIDLAQTELFKREYRVYTQSSMLRSTFAFSSLLSAGYETGKTLLDPFVGSGTIPIEAALHSCNVSPHYYRKHAFLFEKSGYVSGEELQGIYSSLDKDHAVVARPIYGYDYVLKRVHASTYNAKIAGILDAVTFSKIDVDWVDFKFEDKHVDFVVCQPPYFTQHMAKKFEKVYGQFFHRIGSFVSKESKVLVITNNNEIWKKIAAENGWSVVESMDVYEGQQKLYVMSFCVQQH